MNDFSAHRSEDSSESLFDSLAQKASEGNLTPEETKELSLLLDQSEEARELYVQYCQLHAALEHEDELRTWLVEANQPNNVVNLPGTRPFVALAGDAEKPPPKGVVEEGATRPETSAWRKRISIGVAAATVLGVALWKMGSSDPTPSAAVPEALDPGAENPSFTHQEDQTSSQFAKKDSLDESKENNSNPLQENGLQEMSPLEQYASSPVMAQVSPGSQSRPPQPVVTVAATSKISFNRDIRPILSDNCFHCHGPDEEARKADLRLDLRRTAIASESNEGGPILPGEPEASEFFVRILTEDPDDVMPPPDSHKRLTPAQVNLFRQWILEGAEWEEHWAFEPVGEPETPEIDSPWIRNEIDPFVLRRLQEVGLTPNERADRHTLIRRVTLDLTGLPPRPEEILAFVGDDSPDAYERLVDRLLQSSSFGEHRARYWLDAARYADTHGLHLDNYREMWPYRDWVIDAFNRNLPFDQFTIEQLAGDLLPNPTQGQLVATGFNRCNVTTSEGGAIAEEFLVRYAVDRVSTTSTVWMGLTTGCAQCHNHKYDPISMREFYELFAYFNNTTQPGMDGNAKDSPPMIRVYENDGEKGEIEALRGKLRSFDKQQLVDIREKGEGDFQAWLKSPEEAALLTEAKLPSSLIEPVEASAGTEPQSVSGLESFRKDAPFSIAFHFQAPATEGKVVLLEKTDPEQSDRGWRVVLDDQAVTLELIESWPNQMLRSGITRRIKSGSNGHFAITYDGSGTSEGIRFYFRGQEQASRFVREWFDTLAGDFDNDTLLRIGGTDPDSGLSAQINDVRLFDRQLSLEEVTFLKDRSRWVGLAKKPAEKRSDKEVEELRKAWLIARHPPYRKVLVERSKIATEISRRESSRPVTLVMNEKADSPPVAHILERGEYDQKLEQVGAGVPDFLPPLPESAPSNRLGLAQWLVSGQHPLTARVVVNRAWQELFGIGLVKTAEDFGTQGEPPSHPELLDWLAAHFMESGWDIKELYRTLVLSSTYQQSARTTPTLAKQDPENRLLARGPRFRLDAEMIRDQALAASGLLSGTVGGASVRPWQPGGIWEAVGYTNSNTQTFSADFGATAEHRRSVYTFWKRTAPPPNLNAFDAPNRESCTVRRERTNTPLQALVLLNDPQFVRAARHLAFRALNEHDQIDERIDFLALHLTGRTFDAEEKRSVRASLAKFQNAWGSEPESARSFLVDEVNPLFSLDAEREPVELASWAMVASQVLNLDETISKP